MDDWRQDRIGSAHRGQNPSVIARMRSGFAVIGDTQHLPGSSLLLTHGAANAHLSDVRRYPREVRDDPRHAYSAERDGDLRAALTLALEDVMRRAGRWPNAS